MSICTVLVAIAALQTGGCRGRPSGLDDEQPDTQPDTRASAPSGKRHKLKGHASWYGKRFHGRETACGDRFDMSGFTAAHKTLPFHTIVRVRDPSTSKSVDVRINDRGPHKKGRVIDLSRAAAKALGVVSQGAIPVSLHVLEWGDGSRCED